MSKKKLLLFILFLIVFIFFYPSKHIEIYGIPTGSVDYCFGLKEENSCLSVNEAAFRRCEITCYGYNYNNIDGVLGSLIKKFTSSKADY